jgi:glutathione S-transferase
MNAAKIGTAAAVRVTLYRDTHAWCPYCHKVWMQVRRWLSA